jgi:hypothetical protein
MFLPTFIEFTEFYRVYFFQIPNFYWVFTAISWCKKCHKNWCISVKTLTFIEFLLTFVKFLPTFIEFTEFYWVFFFQIPNFYWVFLVISRYKKCHKIWCNSVKTLTHWVFTNFCKVLLTFIKFVPTLMKFTKFYYVYLFSNSPTFTEFYGRKL